MHNKSIIMDKFVSFSKAATKPVLDIGSAYGIASIFSLKEGASVIACDICQAHLDTLVDRAQPDYRHRLKTVLARFPNQTSFANESIHAVLLSHVLSFLDGDEIDEGMKKINNWLDVEGKVFILNYTPYHKTLANFIPVYQKNIAMGEKWPGYIKDKRQFRLSNKAIDNVPNKLNLMDIDILKRLADENGFHIDMLKYIGGVEQGVPSRFCLDGREWVGMIATKVRTV